MHELRDHLFADATLAGDEDLRVGSRRVIDLRFDSPDCGADADETFRGCGCSDWHD
jgi:hypothetical protein